MYVIIPIDWWIHWPSVYRKRDVRPRQVLRLQGPRDVVSSRRRVRSVSVLLDAAQAAAAHLPQQVHALLHSALQRVSLHALQRRLTFTGVHSIAPLWRYGASKIFRSLPWPFAVTWRHRSRDHSTPHVGFPIGGQLCPGVYLARLLRYSASNILRSRPWPFGVTWRHRSRDHSTPLPWHVEAGCFLEELGELNWGICSLSWRVNKTQSFALTLHTKD